MRYLVTFFIFFVFGSSVFADDSMKVDSNLVVTNSFWDNWYGQVGVNMNLLFPYEENIADVDSIVAKYEKRYKRTYRQISICHKKLFFGISNRIVKGLSKLFE